MEDGTGGVEPARVCGVQPAYPDVCHVRDAGLPRSFVLRLSCPSHGVPPVLVLDRVLGTGLGLELLRPAVTTPARSRSPGTRPRPTWPTDGCLRTAGTGPARPPNPSWSPGRRDRPGPDGDPKPRGPRDAHACRDRTWDARTGSIPLAGSRGRHSRSRTSIGDGPAREGGWQKANRSSSGRAGSSDIRREAGYPRARPHARARGVGLPQRRDGNGRAGAPQGGFPIA